jgi:hypothetical protein
MIGREPERALFRSTVEADDLPFCLLHVSGPGGVGKTTLLHAFRDAALDAGAQSVWIDARDVEPSPDAFLAALRAVLDLSASDDPLHALAQDQAARRILFVDTYETLEMLDGWMREAFAPRLPENTLVVLAGRTPLPAAWRSDAGWNALLRTVALRNLNPAEARAFLALREVPESHHQAALDFTHGHPLALSLVADVFAQGGTEPTPFGAAFDPDAAPDVVQELLARLVRDVPGPAHRTALETCALVRLIDEALLSEVLEEEGAASEAPALFQWLGGLSFIARDSHGLYPHDVVREALLADLRWRNRDRYTDLHRRARAYYAARLRRADGPNQQRMLYDCVFLHRDNAVVRAAFTWQEDAVFPDTLRPADHDAVAEMVARHEGDESAAIARRYLEHQPGATLVFRSAAGSPGIAGFFTMLGLHATTDDDRAADPAARAAWEYLTVHHAPLRPGEEVAYLRFWMAHDTYQAASPVQSLIIVNALRQFLTRPRLAYTFFACRDTALWEPVFGYVEIPRRPEAEFTVGGHSYGVFGSDWRETPATAWLSRLAEKETSGAASAATTETAPSSPPPTVAPLVVLSDVAFAGAVRDALRAYLDEEALRRSPLLRSAPVVRRAGGMESGTPARIAALRALLCEAAQTLTAHPRLARGFRAVHHTYFQPAVTQERAAELLDLPFSTYRRHLNEGIAEITQILWNQETGGDPLATGTR